MARRRPPLAHRVITRGIARQEVLAHGRQAAGSLRRLQQSIAMRSTQYLAAC